MEHFVVRIIIASLFLAGIVLNAAGHQISKKKGSFLSTNEWFQEEKKKLKNSSRVCRWQGITYIIIAVLCAYVSLTLDVRKWAIVFGILCFVSVFNSILQLSIAREHKKSFKECEAKYDSWIEQMPSEDFEG